MVEECEHLGQMQKVTPNSQDCEECLAVGDKWVQLRICMICGHVGCCDSTKGQHARKHFEETGHPIIKSFEPGDNWGWCYVDEIMFPSLG